MIEYYRTVVSHVQVSMHDRIEKVSGVWGGYEKNLGDQFKMFCNKNLELVCQEAF